MSKQEEIADDERDEKETIDDEEEQDEESKDSGKKDDKDSADEEDESEDDDDDESDSDDEDDKPLTRKALNEILAKRDNRNNASRRVDSKKRDLPDASRKASSMDEERIARLERVEVKRQFGYENGLAPDEVDVVFRLVKKPRAKDLIDPIVKGALDGYRSAKRARANTPSSNGRPARVTAKKEKNMTPTEKRERFTDRRRQILASKQR